MDKSNRYSKLVGGVMFLLFFVAFSAKAEISPDLGKTLFTNNCAACHAKDMKTNLTGPALGGAQENWDSDEDLYAWIRNSQKAIAAGIPRAVEVWNQYKPIPMTSFDNLTDDEIGSLLAYIDGVHTGTYGPKPAATQPGTGGTVEKSNDGWMYGGLLILLAAVALLLRRIIRQMSKISAGQDGIVEESKTIWQSLTSKGVISFIIFALVVIGGYTSINASINLGRQQGYQPDQPIKFSHETHAGVNKIECQYCHDGARRSKHSVIPAANTCMNCHSAIKSGSKYGTAEITKIYASIGYEPLTNKYIENYDELSQDEVKKIYTDWIADSYMVDNNLNSLDANGERLVNNQWNHIVESLTNDQKKKVQGPIEWTRVHGLPDHVYFNHSQHVTIGKVECQTCHGQIQEMEVVKQHSPLSMGWCVNCHRQTEVKFNGNEYYDSYAKFHEELKDGTRDKVTVSDIGGLECQKCHY